MGLARRSWRRSFVGHVTVGCGPIVCWGLRDILIVFRARGSTAGSASGSCMRVQRVVYVVCSRVGPHDPEQRIPRICAIPARYLLFLLLFRVPMSGIAGIARGISAISQVSILGIAGIADLTIPGAISPTSARLGLTSYLRIIYAFIQRQWRCRGLCNELLRPHVTPCRHRAAPFPTVHHYLRSSQIPA